MMTDRMNKLCELMGIPLIDHIIVGGDNREFFSFREKGMIDNPKITLSTDYRTLDIKSPLVAEQGRIIVRVREEGESMADKVHCIRKTLRLMPEEAKMLAKKACDNGMNEAEYIRLLISQKPNDYPEIRKILKELINEVNRIGININQIVFNNNAGLYSKEDKTQLIAYMRKLNQKVDEAVVKIGNQ